MNYMAPAAPNPYGFYNPYPPYPTFGGQPQMPPWQYTFPQPPKNTQQRRAKPGKLEKEQRIARELIASTNEPC